MVICPNCQSKEITGAIFCTKCGAQLSDYGISTQKIDVIDPDLLSRDEAITKSQASTDFHTWLSLHLMDTGQILPLADRTEFTLGRISEGQPIIPDIDLTPYNAYASGVSRLHSALKIINHQVVLIDLGSSNGTYLNGTRLTPYIEMPVADGDVALLGKLKIQLLISS